MPRSVTVFDVFEECDRARRTQQMIRRANAQDKEFHFQNWFKARLTATRANFEQGGRNSYPDFRMVATTDGFEVKGLAYPGREATYDSNSQIPSGLHNGRTIYYVFGRYPAEPDANTYPVLDLVICHGDFLNIDHEYTHKNRSVRGFGSYGDILIRDRKMYVAPTPFGLVEGLAHMCTLIVPSDLVVAPSFRACGVLVRRETATLIVGYHFDLRRNELTPVTIPNAAAGREHHFVAYRCAGTGDAPVAMRVRVGSEDRIVDDDD